MKPHEEAVRREGLADEWNGNEVAPFDVDGYVVRAWTSNVAASNAESAAPRAQIRWKIDIADVGSFLAFEWHPADTQHYVRQRVASAARVHLRSQVQIDG